MKVDLEKLTIIHYPDPRLQTPSQAVTTFDESLAVLAKRMIELMRAAKGVGLAAPQVGVNLRLFVMSLKEDGTDVRVYANPVIRDLHGSVEAEEGCLSIPGVNVQIRRATRCRLSGADINGRPIELEGRDLECRVWQHETDHLNGVLILDRMGPGDKIAVRKTLKGLEQDFKNKLRK